MHAGFADMRHALSMEVAVRHPRRTLASETERDVRRVLAIWSDCRARHATDGPFLFGTFSVADAMFAPVVWRLYGYDVPIEDAAARAYQETMLELPAMKKWKADAEEEAQRAREASATASAPDPTTARHVYAVIFSSQRRHGGDAEYEHVTQRMVELARQQPGFAGIESARGADGFGITVSYWESLEAIRAWRSQPEHRAVQEQGRSSFYERYVVRVASVERSYGFRL
jgi:heme-degrading monooxygenase HmoA